MTVISVDKDYDALTVVIVAELAAPRERVWELWADPRQLERWWGPPTHPASFERNELAAGAESAYTMTGPDGRTSRGWWRITVADAPARLEFVDGWATPDGTPITDPASTTTVEVELTEHDGRTRMVVRSTFDSRDQLDELDGLGAIEIFAGTIGRMDALLT
ncbi:SRPBCC family protein [Jiangella endophytica]|uniref:SRPBCC family protein n=1 Tax=Jiangella endophytica TaxID=1623398 RepID=UPI000E353E88|nr:SRPBCC domain-containing protein [Jiangella endophytica]